MSRLAVFDCDGTLVDSQHSICVAMAEAFGGLGLGAPTRSEALSVVGLSLPEAMRVLTPGADEAVQRELVAGYKAAFHALRANGGVEEPLYDGIADVVDALAAKGWLLGVATGKSDRGLALCLTRHGLIDRFVTLQTADRHPSKPHPAMLLAAMAEVGVVPQNAVMIGDTSFDVTMARDAGVRALGVAWGYHPAEDLLGAGAFAVALNPGEILYHLEAA